jgi:hypothetical protein
VFEPVGISNRRSVGMIVDSERVALEEDFGGLERNHEIVLRKTTNDESLNFSGGRKDLAKNGRQGGKISR